MVCFINWWDAWCWPPAQDLGHFHRIRRLCGLDKKLSTQDLKTNAEELIACPRFACLREGVYIKNKTKYTAREYPF